MLLHIAVPDLEPLGRDEGWGRRGRSLISQKAKLPTHESPSGVLCSKATQLELMLLHTMW